MSTWQSSQHVTSIIYFQANTALHWTVCTDNQHTCSNCGTGFYDIIKSIYSSYWRNGAIEVTVPLNKTIVSAASDKQQQQLSWSRAYDVISCTITWHFLQFWIFTKLKRQKTLNRAVMLLKITFSSWKHQISDEWLNTMAMTKGKLQWQTRKAVSNSISPKLPLNPAP